MFEQLISWATSLPAIIAIIFFGILAASNNAEDWSVFWGVVLVAVLVPIYNLTLVQTIFLVVIYFLVGFLWSFYRYKVWVKNSVDQYDQTYANKGMAVSREEYFLRLRPNKNVSLILMWVLIWPFSIVENLCSDLVRFLRDLVKVTFSSVYLKLFESVTSAARNKESL